MGVVFTRPSSNSGTQFLSFHSFLICIKPVQVSRPPPPSTYLLSQVDIPPLSGFCLLRKTYAISPLLSKTYQPLQIVLIIFWSSCVKYFCSLVGPLTLTFFLAYFPVPHLPTVSGNPPLVLPKQSHFIPLPLGPPSLDKKWEYNEVHYMSVLTKGKL